MTAAADLGAFITQDEARRLAASLERDGLVHQAVKALETSRREEGKSLLLAVLEESDGDKDVLIAVLRALSGVHQAAQPQLVWTSPSLPGLMGHTTLAVSELINEAESFIYAATYSATMDSPYIMALLSALDRGVKVTLVVDREHQTRAARAVAEKLVGARIWTLAPREPDEYAAQHAKLVMIDGFATFVTSANFSSAAADSNLECGVLLRDSAVARAVKTQLDTLRKMNYLVDFAE